MATIRISGSVVGFRKVSHTNLLREAAGLGLAEAKGLTDAVPRGEVVSVTVPSGSAAERLVERLREIGAVANVG